MTTESESPLEPDDAEVLQAEAEPSLTCVPVTVEGPARTQELPCKSAGRRRYVVGATEAFKVLPADPRRKIARMVALTQGMYVGNTKSEAEGAYAEQWPAGVEYVVEDSGDVWVMSVSGSITVSMHSSQWAD